MVIIIKTKPNTTGIVYPLVNIQKAIENGLVHFPIKNCDFPWQNVSSPEGIPIIFCPH